MPAVQHHFRRSAGLLLGLALALLLFAKVSMAQPGAGLDRPTVEALMRSSGFWGQLGQMAPQARSGIQEMLDKLEPPPSATERERVVRLADEAYSADRMRASALALMRARLQAAHLPALRSWYDSATGQQISRIEEAASSDATDPQLQMQRGQALLEQLPPARRALLEELAQVIRIGEVLAQLMIETSLAGQGAALSLMPNAPSDAGEQLRALLEAQRPQLVTALGQAALASFALRYTEVADAQMAQYIAFLASPAGQHYTEVGVQALQAAFVDAARAIGLGMAGTSDKLNT